MVDPLGPKTVRANDQRLAPVGAVAAIKAPRSAVAEPAGVAASALAAVVADLATSPPVDAERVARIKQAIASGHYPITPESIADRLIALKLNWSPHDPS
ncbi:MAG: flagellar biosynthesis anti-sigma factor FlgM [Sphingomonas sp. 28-66-16]|nr:MAG: flagellar biosynthesis anti-sigma factor FlgM [Sphingomonas sp. 28-66-16]